jgi:hypothetical protein
MVYMATKSAFCPFLKNESFRQRSIEQKGGVPSLLAHLPVGAFSPIFHFAQG